jgi:hypothetical protein
MRFTSVQENSGDCRRQDSCCSGRWSPLLSDQQLMANQGTTTNGWPGLYLDG